VSSEQNFRGIDTSIALLEGEASHQRVKHDDKHLLSVASEPWHYTPAPVEADPAYYDRPMLKAPVWIWAVPLYFYVGGLSGAAMVLGASAQIAGGWSLRRFVRRCRWVGGIGGAVGSALLIADLGKPTRFMNMLRVFRPTSPMNLGAWVLATAAPTAMGSAMWSRESGVRGAMAQAGGIVAGILGMPLAGYTAVLITNSAVPAWQGARRSMPLLFIGSAITSAASLFDMMDLGRREHRLVGAFGTMGRVTELIAARAVEREPMVERVRRPYTSGASGTLLKIATALTAASLIASFLPSGRKKRFAAGALGTAGAIALRYGIYLAGKQSAADPRASFHQQRQGFGAAEVTKEIVHAR
jgi:MFS family permease